MQEENDIFSGCSKEVFKEIRATIIELVLATDFSRHLEVLGQFKSRKAAGGNLYQFIEYLGNRLIDCCLFVYSFYRTLVPTKERRSFGCVEDGIEMR